MNQNLLLNESKFALSKFTVHFFLLIIFEELSVLFTNGDRINWKKMTVLASIHNGGTIFVRNIHEIVA